MLSAIIYLFIYLLQCPDDADIAECYYRQGRDLTQGEQEHYVGQGIEGLFVPIHGATVNKNNT